MRVDIIHNSGIRTLAQELEEQMLTSNHFEIATAFITEEVLELIESFFDKNKSKHKAASLITGLYNCFNSKEVLVALQKLCMKYKGKLEVNISREERFHWKYYYFERTNSSVVYCGSANFTGSGINKPGELVTKLSLSNKDKDISEHFKNTFNKEWNNSIPINSLSFDNYKQNKQSALNTIQLDKSISDLLKNKKTTTPVINKNPNIRVVFIPGRVSTKTEKIIFKQRSNWESDDRDFLCFTRKTDYEAALKVSSICVIYKENRNYEFHLGTIMDNDINYTLNEGPYFILYKINKRRSETKSIRLNIEDIGLNYHSSKFSDKTLGIKQTQGLLKALK